MRKIIIVGLCILLLFMTGATYKLNLFTLLNEYEEECIEYKVDNWIELHCYDWVGGWHYKMYNETHLDKSDSYTCNDRNFWHTKNFTIYNTTNECIKYLLVRKV